MHAVGPGYGRQETWVEKRLLSDRTADDARIGLLVKCQRCRFRAFRELLETYAGERDC